MGKGIKCVSDNYVDAFVRFTVTDAFVGYQDDTPASVILHVHQKSTCNCSDNEEVHFKPKFTFLALLTPYIYTGSQTRY